MQDIGTLDGDPTTVSSVYAINNNGWVVGESNSGNNTYAFLWTPSAGMQALNFGGTFSWAYGISSSGTVVGSYITASGAIRGFKYNSGTMTDTGVLQPLAINDNGQTASLYYNSANGSSQTYLVKRDWTSD